jgi:hypothetical protein
MGKVWHQCTHLSSWVTREGKTGGKKVHETSSQWKKQTSKHKTGCGGAAFDITATLGSIKWENNSPGQTVKKIQIKRAGHIAQVVENLPSKCIILSP